MLVNHKYRFLFVHIPKTSGATFRAYNCLHLSPRWWKRYEEVGGAHDPLTRAIAERYRDYYKFAIVRPLGPHRLGLSLRDAGRQHGQVGPAAAEGYQSPRLVD